MIGTVSPAGGNFEEPVTQATLSTVKCFLGLSYDRAYKRFYPAVDPLISWSRYLDQLKDYFAEHLGPDWITHVKATQQLLQDGANINQMMQVTGEEGVTLDDFVRYQQSLFVDMVYLQQDGFDAVDAAVSLERQKQMFGLIQRVLDRDFDFRDKEQVRQIFVRLTGLFKNLNYAPQDSSEYQDLMKQIEELRADKLAVIVEATSHASVGSS